MRIAYRIVLCGQSIFLHTIEAALAENPAIEVLRLHPSLPSIVKRIMAWQPDIVLVERKPKHNELVLALLDQGLPLVELEAAAKRGTFLVGRDIPFANLDDLTYLIQERIKSTITLPAKSDRIPTKPNVCETDLC